MTDRPNLLWIKPGQAEIMEYCEPEEASDPYAIYRRANLMAGLPLFVVIAEAAKRTKATNTH